MFAVVGLPETTKAALFARYSRYPGTLRRLFLAPTAVILVLLYGIPLLIILQIYQWAVVNNGLRDVINTPNLTVDEFVRIILEQANF